GLRVRGVHPGDGAEAGSCGVRGVHAVAVDRRGLDRPAPRRVRRGVTPGRDRPLVARGMKLERVALEGFLSHGHTDWSPNGARLVSLVGANGAGKSSLLDGVSYALFDEARARTDDLVQLGQTNMSATVEFAFAGERYRVTRGRSTRSGGKTFLELAVARGEAWT